MATQPLMRSLSTRTVKKLEKPRPLKISSSQSKLVPGEPSPRVSLPFQDIMMLVESVSHSLADLSFNCDEVLVASITAMHSKLKVHGQQLEAIFKDQLDRAFVIFRDGCQNDSLPCTTRLHLLELVELRANQWSNCDNTQIYYSAKMSTPEVEPMPTVLEVNNTNSLPVSTSVPSPPSTPVLGPGEVLKTSGKFPKPTKIPGKSYCKDEVVIRNSDSGKVNPGAKERLVQITGPSEDKIVHARHLMEDTIRRNASPVRELAEEKMGGSSLSLNSSASEENVRNNLSGSKGRSLLHSYSTNDASLGEYKYTVTLGGDTVKITGANHETVRNVRLLVEECYHMWLQKNCFADTYGCDDVFLDPVQVDMLRMNSYDSGLDPGFGYLTTPVALESPVEYPVTPQPERRALRGRSNSTPPPTTPILIENSPVTIAGTTRKYSREFLLELTLSPHSNASPPNWDQIVRECPAIIKKGSSPFDAKAFAKRVTASVSHPIIDLSNDNGDSD